MSLTVTEASAVNHLLRYVLGLHRPGFPAVSTEQARQAAILLADHADRTLSAGLTGRDVEAAAWHVIEHDIHAEHVIKFNERGWTIKHPLACRPNLFECPVHAAAEQQIAQPPEVLGRYTISLADDGLLYLGDPADEATRAAVDAREASAP